MDECILAALQDGTPVLRYWTRQAPRAGEIFRVDGGPGAEAEARFGTRHFRVVEVPERSLATPAHAPVRVLVEPAPTAAPDGGTGVLDRFVLSERHWVPPPALRAYTVPPAAGRPAPGRAPARGAYSALYDAGGSPVWGFGAGRWSVVHAQWRLRDGRWLQARQKRLGGGPVMLAVTATARARDEPRVRWHRFDRFPIAELLGPPPTEHPAWAALLDGTAQLADLDDRRKGTPATSLAAGRGPHSRAQGD